MPQAISWIMEFPLCVLGEMVGEINRKNIVPNASPAAVMTHCLAPPAPAAPTKAAAQRLSCSLPWGLGSWDVLHGATGCWEGSDLYQLLQHPPEPGMAYPKPLPSFQPHL